MTVLRLSRLVLIACSVVLGACWDDPPAAPSDDFINAANGRLQAVYTTPTKSVSPGIKSLQLSAAGRAFGLYVPNSYDPTVPAPVVVLLHGRGGNGEALALEFREIADRAGVIVITPNSKDITWDLILGSTGFDVAFIDGVIKWAFDNINVDPDRFTIGGFSDGATYATWLGLRNGALFKRVALFSGCANEPGGRVGQPTIYVTHGVADAAFPIDSCARVLVPALRTRGYTVEYTEHDAGHIIPVPVADAAFAWIARR